MVISVIILIAGTTEIQKMGIILTKRLVSRVGFVEDNTLWHLLDRGE